MKCFCVMFLLHPQTKSRKNSSTRENNDLRDSRFEGNFNILLLSLHDLIMG